MEIKIAMTDGEFERATAEPITVCGKLGLFAVHERILEPRHITTAFHHWTVTHIQSGRRFVGGMTKEDAVKEAERQFKLIGIRKINKLVAAFVIS